MKNSLDMPEFGDSSILAIFQVVLSNTLFSFIANFVSSLTPLEKAKRTTFFDQTYAAKPMRQCPHLEGMR